MIKKLLSLTLGAIMLVTLLCGGLAGCAATDDDVMPVVLLTDFGAGDYRVPVTKGIIYSTQPEALILDASHEVPAFDVWTGAFVLWASAEKFPADVVFMACVAPGTSTRQYHLVMKTDNGQIFVAPDNGLLTYVAQQYGVDCLYRIDNENLFDKPLAELSVHHILAKVGGLLAGGMSPGEAGSKLDSPQMLDIQVGQRDGTELSGSVIYIDRFGNCITNIATELLADAGYASGDTIIIDVNGSKIVAEVGQNYGDVALGQPVVLPSDLGLLQLSVNMDSFASLNDAGPGTTVKLE
jgi:S-adenosyl-L-methionine hydrolase (adenosine-forming)